MKTPVVGALAAAAPVPPVPTTAAPATTQVVLVPPLTTAPSQVLPVAPSAAPSSPPAIVAIPPTLDKDGLPWDQRIHSGSKSLNKDGTWRLRKGLDEAVLKAVTAELKGVMAIPSPTGPSNIPAVPTSIPAPAAPVQMTLLPLTAAEAGQIPRPPRVEVPAPPAAAVNIPIPPPPTVAAVPGIPAGYTPDLTRPGIFLPPTLGFGEVMFKVAQAVATGRLNQAQVDAVCAEIGLPGLSMLGARPDLIPTIVSKLGL